MRRFFIFIVFALCSFWQLRAQADTASFLFDKYEDAQVVLRAGGELKSKMNYNIVANKFYFVDPQDKQKGTCKSGRYFADQDRRAYVLSGIQRSRNRNVADKTGSVCPV